MKRMNRSDVKVIVPYHFQYDGVLGHAQVFGRIKTPFVAIPVKNTRLGCVHRIMKINTKTFFMHPEKKNAVCTSLIFERTDFIVTD